MAEEYNRAQVKSESESNDTMDLQSLFYLCLSKWYWFLISLVIAFALAVLYILITPPIYTRQASMLIKDENSHTISNEFGKFSDVGGIYDNTNLFNEIIALRSPSYVQDVVKNLHLDINYITDGLFHDNVLYGKSLPVAVSLPDIEQEEYASFVMTLLPNGVVEMKDFVRSTKPELESKTIKAKVGTVAQTPIGKVMLTPTKYYVEQESSPISVKRYGFADATTMYVGKLTISLNDDRSSVLDIKVEDASWQRAEDVINNLYDVYNKKWIENINKQAISTSQYIDDELRQIESELGNVDADISTYKSQNLVPNVDMAATMSMNRAEVTGTQLMELNNQLYMANYIKNQLANDGNKFSLLPANSGINNASVAQQILSYNEKVLQRNNLVSNSSTTNPLVVDLDQNLKAMRQAIAASLDNVIVTLKERIGNLRGSESATKRQIASNPSQAKYLLSVERQQKVKEQLYIFLLQKREENQLTKVFTANNTEMLAPPSGPKIPTKPVKLNILMMALLLGIIIPLVAIIVANNLDTVVRYRRDLDNLSLPFIGEIPLSYNKKTGFFGLFQKRHKEVREIVVQEKSGNVINEAFRVVRTNLEFVSGKEDRCKTIMFTSANPGSGKTFISMNLATSFAIKGKKVLVIDLDLRKASLSSFVNSPEMGISNYLSERADDLNAVIVKGTINPNLDVLPVGTIPPNPTELLFSDRLTHMFNEMKEKYDYIFVDCPPLDIVADASIINSICDMTVFVIRSGLFDKRMLPDLERNYEEKRYKNMTIILNGVYDDTNGYGYRRYGYGYGGYGYGYGYGSLKED